jgi:hypothetical protein
MKWKLLKTTGLLLLMALAACNQQSENPQSRIVALGIGPNLAVSPAGTAVVSYIASTDDAHALRFQLLDDGQWSNAQTVSSGPNWFVNWADFPSVQPITETLWAAHWLVRREAGGYAYDVHAAVSEDAGQTWSENFLPHSDGTDTEHGFVTLFAAGDRVGAMWLDGRNMASHDEESEDHAETIGMTLRAGQFGADGVVSNEQVVDGLTCDCCQTDVAQTDQGPVSVYRNRTPEEIRDIYISRFVGGSWQEGQAVHDDGWNIAGCPVNGPVVKANGSTVIVTWFTAADNNPVVKSAWSHDAGRTFAAPVTVANEGVIGYVASALLPDNSITASWLCKAPEQKNAICYRALNEDGELGTVRRLETQGVVPRMSVPQLANIDGQLLFVWTDKVDDQLQIKSRFVALDPI